MVLILDGKKVCDEIAKDLRKKIGELSSKPKLVIVQIGDNKESAAYIRQKKTFGENIGTAVEHIQLSESVPLSEVLLTIQQFNKDSATHGIIIQMPIPALLDRDRILDAIAPEKDVDGLGSASVKALWENKKTGFVPATTKGILSLLDYFKIPISGKRVTVVGRSFLVGKPTAIAFLNRDATVTVGHSKTENLSEVTRDADVLVVAAGKPNLINADYFRGDRTQAVVDVGITAVTEKGEERLEEEIPKRRLVGDVDFEAVKEMVFAISPVPGGVGPMTVASLFQNLVEAYERQVKPQ